MVDASQLVGNDVGCQQTHLNFPWQCGAVVNINAHLDSGRAPPHMSDFAVQSTPCRTADHIVELPTSLHDFDDPLMMHRIVSPRAQEADNFVNGEAWDPTSVSSPPPICPPQRDPIGDEYIGVNKTTTHRCHEQSLSSNEFSLPAQLAKLDRRSCRNLNFQQSTRRLTEAHTSQLLLDHTTRANERHIDDLGAHKHWDLEYMLASIHRTAGTNRLTTVLLIGELSERDAMLVFSILYGHISLSQMANLHCTLDKCDVAHMVTKLIL